MTLRLAVAAASLFFLCALLGGVAHADRVRTTKTTKVFKRTGEQSGVVTKVAKGKTLQVVAKQGRWLKVRVNGRTGWVTQSSVVSLEARDLPRNTRRRPFVDGRSTRRGWGGGAPEDRVGADAVEEGDDGRGEDEADDEDDETGRGSRASRDDDDDDRRRRSRDEDEDDDEEDEDEEDTLRMVTVTAKKAKVYPRASKKAKAVLTVRRGAQLIVLDEHESGKWIRVEDDEGSAGWIAADAVSSDDDRRGPPRKRVIAAAARLGFASVGGKFTSNGTAMMGANPPVDYGYGSTAVSIAVGGELTMPFKKDYFVGGELEYLGCVATPGIRYSAGMMAEDIGFKTHDIDVRLLGGYDFHKANGMTAWLRLGYHYGAFSVSNLNNLAKLPSETFKGPTMGAALRIPRLAKKIGAEASLDLVYPGTRKQTVGISDGALQKAQAATLDLLGMYDWKRDWKLTGGYRFGYAASRWSGTSDRVPTATSSKRTDLSHVVTVGLGRAF